MSLARYAKRRDETERAIVEALRAVGADVLRIDRPCDLLVRFRGIVHLIEIDGITRYRRRAAAQVRILNEWSIPRVRCSEDALRAIGAMP
jgi:hypothetical protein